jgi:formate dehydrogenase
MADLPIRRDLLIEALHRIRDTHCSLEPENLKWLAEAFKVSKSEIFEIITFYDRFTPFVSQMPYRSVESRMIDAATIPSMEGPIECINPVFMTPASVPASVNARDIYDKAQNVINVIEEAGLRGMGGAGYLTAAKWHAVKSQPGPRYLIVNANEGEIGSAKDRYLLIHATAQVLIGALVSATVIGANTIYFYLRNKYIDLMTRIAKTADELASDWPDIVFHWRRGAGSYVCGEETALIESIEGHPARPRSKPPFPTDNGLFGRPTLVNNVETLFWINEILVRGGKWYATKGLRGGKGLRMFSLSGKVSRPGIYIAPNGITLSELISDCCCGMQDGHQLTAFLPDGAGGGILPASFSQLPLYIGSLESHGAGLGSASLIVLSHQDVIRDVVGNLMEFLAQENCGQCMPCRLGVRAAADILKEQHVTSDEDLLKLANALSMGTICGLGQSAGRLLDCYRRFFHKG